MKSPCGPFGFREQSHLQRSQVRHFPPPDRVATDRGARRCQVRTPSSLGAGSHARGAGWSPGSSTRDAAARDVLKLDEPRLGAIRRSSFSRDCCAWKREPHPNEWAPKSTAEACGICKRRSGVILPGAESSHVRKGLLSAWRPRGVVSRTKLEGSAARAVGTSLCESGYTTHVCSPLYGNLWEITAVPEESAGAVGAPTSWSARARSRAGVVVKTSCEPLRIGQLLFLYGAADARTEVFVVGRATKGCARDVLRVVGTAMPSQAEPTSCQQCIAVLPAPCSSWLRTGCRRCSV
jgi:hypothetical protein